MVSCWRLRCVSAARRQDSLQSINYADAISKWIANCFKNKNYYWNRYIYANSICYNIPNWIVDINSLCYIECISFDDSEPVTDAITDDFTVLDYYAVNVANCDTDIDAQFIADAVAEFNADPDADAIRLGNTAIHAICFIDKF